MKLEIFKKEKEEDKTRLAFEMEGDTINVTVVDCDGDRMCNGDLVGFRKDGTIERYSAVNDSLGFKLDSRGKVKLIE